MYSIQYTVYSVRCQVYSVKGSMGNGENGILCTVYTGHLYTVYWFTRHLGIQYTGIQKGGMGNGKGNWKRVRLV